MIRRVIYFVESPFNKRDYDRFGIEILQKNGFEVEVWDFTPFLHPQVHRNVKALDPINYECYKQFENQNLAIAAISELTLDSLVICFVGYAYKSIPLYQALSKCKLRYAVWSGNTLPVVRKGRRLLGMLTNLQSVLNPSKIVNAVVGRIPCSWLKIRPAALLLAGGGEAVTCNRLIGAATNVLWLHALDYDLYLQEKFKPVQAEMVGVFLDEYLPFHPDYGHLGISLPVTPADYFCGICSFFDLLERRYNVKIIIAAHPLSQYEEHPDYFGGRPVIRGKTIELIRSAKFVVAHSSTAVNFAVLFKKPIIFITSNSLEKSRVMGEQIRSVAEFFNKKPCNVDSAFSIDWEREMTVEEIAYERYRGVHIKSDGTAEKLSWEIVAEFLKREKA